MLSEVMRDLGLEAELTTDPLGGAQVAQRLVVLAEVDQDLPRFLLDSCKLCSTSIRRQPLT